MAKPATEILALAGAVMEHFQSNGIGYLDGQPIKPFQIWQSYCCQPYQIGMSAFPIHPWATNWGSVSALHAV